MEKVRQNYKSIFEKSEECYHSGQWEKCIELYSQLISVLKPNEYMLIDCNPDIPMDIYYSILFHCGNALKTLAERDVQKAITDYGTNEATQLQQKKKLELPKQKQKLFEKAIELYNNILIFKFEDANSITQLVSIFTQLAFFYQNTDTQKCINYLKTGLLYHPTNSILHYNLGHIYKKILNFPEAIVHFKLSISLTNEIEYKIRGYHGLAGIFKSVKRWPDALYYLKLAQKLNQLDPDISNLLGIVYTEMRRTDLAKKEYLLGISNYKSCFISTDKVFLLGELYLNLGHMHSYNGDNLQSVDCYNKALKIIPKFTTAFQNKLMNLLYLSDTVPLRYIYSQHKLISLLLPKETTLVFVKKSNLKSIGFVSGDLIDHPVSFFITSFLNSFDSSKFKVTLYSQTPIPKNVFKKCETKLIKNLPSEKVKELIIGDNIEILIDLSGHTAENRLDIFSLRSAPVQISYCGYPFSTGLKTMDYKIVDNKTDHPIHSQKYYTEKLLFVPSCFLCYTPPCIPEITEDKDTILKIGCFNRLNKITDSMIEFFNKILQIPNTQMYFKTKALLNQESKKLFLNKFVDPSKVVILDCNLSVEEHLLEYSKINISIDTFPYSGTTTSCESLLMGVPVLTLKDTVNYLHSQNVTSSILFYSNLEKYIFEDLSKMIKMITKMSNYKKNGDLSHLKRETREIFLNSSMTNKNIFVKNFSDILLNSITHSPNQLKEF